MFTSFLHWLAAPAARGSAHELYIALVAQARQPFFYEALDVPDSVDGRFDMILLHVFLFTHRMREENTPQSNRMAGVITDLFFADMDRNLREMGVGDLSVGKKIKKMADALNGRFVAYAKAIDDEEAMQFALLRNVYGAAKPSDDKATRLTRYCLDAYDSFSKQPVTQLYAPPLLWPAIG